MAEEQAVDYLVFVKKVIITISVLSITFLLFIIVLYGYKILMLLFAAALLAILYRGCAFWLAGKLKISVKILLPVILLIHIGFSVFVIWKLAPHISEQIQIMSTTIPGTVSNLEQKFLQSATGQFIIRELPESSALLKDPGKILHTIFYFFRGTLNIIVNLIVIVALAIFLVGNPGLYRRGFLYFFPPEKRGRVNEIIQTINITLFKWFIGKILDMTTIFIMTAVALWILGIPLVLTLALIAFIFSFIPNIGPVIAAIPAILIAFTEKPVYALYVGFIYLGIQFIETYFITPKIQKKAIQMPPVLLLIFQLFIAIFGGVLGLFLSTPILATLTILIQMGYIEDTLGDYSIGVKEEEVAKNTIEY